MRPPPLPGPTPVPPLGPHYMLYSYWHIQERYPMRAGSLDADRMRHHAWLIASFDNETSRMGSVAFAHKGKFGELNWMRSDFHGSAERWLSPMTNKLEMACCEFSYIGSLAQQPRRLHFEVLWPSSRMFLGVHLGQAWCVVIREESAEKDPRFVHWLLNLPGTHRAELALREELSWL